MNLLIFRPWPWRWAALPNASKICPKSRHPPTRSATHWRTKAMARSTHGCSWPPEVLAARWASRSCTRTSFTLARSTSTRRCSLKSSSVVEGRKPIHAKISVESFLHSSRRPPRMPTKASILSRSLASTTFLNTLRANWYEAASRSCGAILSVTSRVCRTMRGTSWSGPSIESETRRALLCWAAVATSCLMDASRPCTKRPYTTMACDTSR
mmetsp:Transcript_18274/g.41771  ORF Transcript_18274/g.41771 Transcript_18274/m.41771 type:complete len:211 (-) Transcript_18274:31-663(-)